MQRTQTTMLDSGYNKAGTYWEVHQYRLINTNLYEVRVGGKATQFRKRDACYDHLEKTGVTRFRRSGPAARRNYEPYEPDQEVADESSSDGGEDSR
jgi:hypothetical protein